VRASLTLLIVSLSIGCAHNSPVKPSALGNSATLAYPLEVVWERTVHVLAAQIPVVQSADFAHFFITTGKATVKLNETQADCAMYSGSPYRKNGRTLTEVAYSVYLQRDGKRASIVVNAEIAGRFKASATQETTTELSCVSLGTLERELITKIQQEQRWASP